MTQAHHLMDSACGGYHAGHERLSLRDRLLFGCAMLGDLCFDQGHPANADDRSRAGAPKSATAEDCRQQNRHDVSRTIATPQIHSRVREDANNLKPAGSLAITLCAHSGDRESMRTFTTLERGPDEQGSMSCLSDIARRDGCSAIQNPRIKRR